MDPEEIEDEDSEDEDGDEGPDGPGNDFPPYQAPDRSEHDWRL